MVATNIFSRKKNEVKANSSSAQLSLSQLLIQRKEGKIKIFPSEVFWTLPTFCIYFNFEIFFRSVAFHASLFFFGEWAFWHLQILVSDSFCSSVNDSFSICAFSDINLLREQPFRLLTTRDLSLTMLLESY